MTTALVTFYDAVYVPAIPPDATIIAVYVDGEWPTEAAVRARFLQAHLITITVTGSPDNMVCDCETGDLTPAQAAQWAADEKTAGRRPTIYCNESTTPDVVAALAVHGLTFGRDVDHWLAAPDGIAEVPEGCVAKQYWWGPGIYSYDADVALPTWSALPQPKPPAPEPEATMCYFTWLGKSYAGTVGTDNRGHGVELGAGAVKALQAGGVKFIADAEASLYNLFVLGDVPKAA